MDHATLEMALVGYQAERQKIEAAMTAIRKQLGGRYASAAAPTGNGTQPKRVLSAAARRRIAAAQKKRWAAFRKSSTAAKKATAKRKLS